MNRNILLNKTPQLVDLNGDTTNFDITFTVTSKNKEPFYLVVVDQKTLDVNPNFSFRQADEGQLSGNIVSDKNVYQNYFLCLKADEDCEVNIEIIKKEIQPNVVKEEYIPQQQKQQHKEEDESFLSRNWKWLLILLIAGGVLLYIWKIKKKDETSSPVESSVPSSPIPSSPVESLYNTQENIDYNTSDNTDLNSSFFNNSNTSKNLLQRIQNMAK